MKEHFQVEYKDGLYQWIKYSEKYKLNNKEIKRIVATCSSDIDVDTKKKKKNDGWIVFDENFK